jgi:hypothetical protein
MQGAITRLIANATALMQAYQKRRQPAEILQPDNVLLGDFTGLVQDTQTLCAGKLKRARPIGWDFQFFSTNILAQILCRTGLLPTPFPVSIIVD